MKKRYLGLVAAAVLTVAPVAASVSFVSTPATAQAATKKLSSNQLMSPYYVADNRTSTNPVIRLSKKSAYLNARNGETVSQLRKQKLTGLKSNYGRVGKRVVFRIYNTLSDGTANWNEGALSGATKLQSGKNYVAVVSYKIVDLSKKVGNEMSSYYDYLTIDPNISDQGVDWNTSVDEASVALLLPVRVSSSSYKAPAKSTKKVTKKKTK